MEGNAPPRRSLEDSRRDRHSPCVLLSNLHPRHSYERETQPASNNSKFLNYKLNSFRHLLSWFSSAPSMPLMRPMFSPSFSPASLHSLQAFPKRTLLWSWRLKRHLTTSFLLVRSLNVLASSYVFNIRWTSPYRLILPHRLKQFY